MKFKVQLVLWTNPQEKQLEVFVEDTNAINAVRQAEKANPGFFGVSAEAVEE